MWQRWAQRGLLGLSVLLGCVLIYLLMTNSTASPPPTATAPGTINQADAIISKFTFTQTKATPSVHRVVKADISVSQTVPGRKIVSQHTEEMVARND